jgi:TamB, inner membrane protein subunit of TAM complex
LKKSFKILYKTILGIIVFLMLLAFAIQTNWMQNWLVGIATNYLSKQLHTQVSVKRVSFSLFNKANIEGIFIKDKQQDTILYAGALKLKLTDWFFLKEKTQIKYIGLDDAVIKLQRTDTTWNYDFIANYFAPKNKSNNKKNNPIELSKIDIKNISFTKNDKWRGELMKFYSKSFVVNFDSINIEKNKFLLSDVAIENPQFTIKQITANRPKNYLKNLQLEQEKPIDADKKLEVVISEFVIKNGKLSILNGDVIPSKIFDGDHIVLTNLNTKFTNLSLKNETLKANISISAKERSGLELKQLKASFKFTSKIMELSNLDLKTNSSHLTNYYAMKFANFDDDFADYEKMVTMDAHFINSFLSTNDLAFFSSDLKTWQKELDINGNFLGTVNNFKVTNLKAKEKNNTTTIYGNLAMKGLPNIDKTIINFTNGYISTNHKDLSAIVPSLKGISTPNISALGNIKYIGDFNGTISNFTTVGKLQTNLGNIATNISMNLPSNKTPTYKGFVTIDSFNLATFLNESKLGFVDFNGSFEGSSFNLATIKTKLVGNLKTFDFNGYTYKNIVTNGTLKNSYFNGEVKINDPNLQINGQIEANLVSKIPSYNILVDITKSNLKPLNFYADNVSLTGLLDVFISGTNIDNYIGTAKFLNGNIKAQNKQIYFDSIALSSSYRDSLKILHLTSNELDANVVGDFKILDLPNCFQSFLHNYYPSYIAATKTLAKNQKFAVTINTKNIEPYLQLVDKNIKGFNDASLSGVIDTKNKLFNLGISIPYGNFKKYTITNANIIGKGDIDTLRLSGNIGGLAVSDSLTFLDAKIGISSSHDISAITLKTQSNSALNEANLNANITTLTNGIHINFKPSMFVLNNKTWNLEKEGEILLTNTNTSAKNVKFIQGFQEIAVETKTLDGTNTNSLNINLKNLVMGDIAALFSSNKKVEGLATGSINLENVFDKITAKTNLQAKEFRFGNDSIGEASLLAYYDSKTGKIKFDVESPNEGYNFSVEGIYDIKDTTNKPLQTTMNLKNSKIDIVQRFIGDEIFSDISGYATGKLQFSGQPSNPKLFGKVKITNTRLKVNYTQVYYKIDSAMVSFENDGIDFGSFIIKDTIGNTGTVSGKLYEKDFKNMKFDFDVSTNKLLLLNTTVVNNTAFFGNVIGKANLSFKGPENNCKMSINGEANEASQITIPNSDAKETSNADFIVFKQIGEEIQKASTASNVNITVDLDVIANNLVTFNVVMDELSGDVISATGNGRLKIKVGTSENLDMRGRYNIEQGKYNFSFQSIFKKPFLVKPNGNNFIEWSGDPFGAIMHLDAMYEAKNIGIKDLIGNSQVAFNSASQSYRDDVYVIASLNGKLANPDIKFSFDFPANSPIKNDEVFMKFKSRIENDENEILKQVTFLIVLNSFAPVGDNNTAQTNYGYIGINTLSSILTRQINAIATNVLSNLFKDKSINVDFSTNAYSSTSLFGQNDAGSSSNGLDRLNLKLKIGTNILKGKARFTFGSDLDFKFGGSSSNSGNFQWLPDWNLEWFLSQDKNFLFIAFSKNSLDISGNSLGRRTRQGIGLSYKKDFEKSPFEKKNSTSKF